MGKKLTRKEQFNFIVSRVGAGIVAVCGLGVAGIHAANHHIYDSTLTPANFTAAQGASYSAPTTSWLKKFDDIRVVSVDDPVRNVYCRIAEAFCADSGFNGDFAYIPTPLTRAIGMRPVVFLNVYSPEYQENLLKSVVGKSPVPSEERSKHAFSFVVFHELGHVETSRDVGEAAYQNLPVQVKEAGAENRALPHLLAEFGSKALAFPRNFRALTQAEPTHDILTRSYAPHGAAPTTSFTTILEKCGVAFPQTHADTPAMLDGTYACLKTRPAEKGELGLRAQNYVTAYEYFFKKEPSAP